MAEENQARVYGMADQANRHPPAAQGTRGEKASTRPGDPEFSHAVTLDSGKQVVVSEGNGVAYAEATGRTAVARNREELDVEFIPEEASSRASRTPMLIGALVAGAGAGLYLADRWLRGRTDRPSTDHTTGPLVPMQEIPHRQPALIDPDPMLSASRI